MHRGCIISYFSRHITLQPWLPTEAKQGWAWSVPGWETSWVKLGCCWKRCLWDQQGVLTLLSVWVLMPQYSDGDTILSFGWDVKLRTWPSVVIKNPRKSFEKSRGVTRHPGRIFPLAPDHHGLLTIPIHWLASSLWLFSTNKLVCGGRSSALWLPSHNPGGCCTLVVNEEIPPFYVKRFEYPEKRYINVT